MPSGQPVSRTRSWGLITLAALMVVGSGLAVAAWGLRVGDKQAVLTVARPVAAGQIIERDALVSSAVAGVEGAIPVAQIDSVVGTTAAVSFVEGQILMPEMMTSTPVPAAGESVIGLALDPTRVPGAGLEAGDVVDVIAVPAPDASQANPTSLETPETLASAAVVFAVGGDSTVGGQVLVTLVVPAAEAARIAAYSTQNRVAVVETTPTVVASSGSDAASRG